MCLIVCGIQYHLRAPLFCVHLEDGQFLIVILAGHDIRSTPPTMCLCGCCKNVWKHFEADDFDIDINSLEVYYKPVLDGIVKTFTSTNVSVQQWN